MKKLNGKFRGQVSIDNIQFSEIRTEVVARWNKFGGRIGFPNDDIGKVVYILYPEVPKYAKRK